MERDLALYLSERESLWLCRLLGSLNCKGESTEPLGAIYNNLADRIESRGLVEHAWDLAPLNWLLVDHGLVPGKKLIRFEGEPNDS